MSFISFLQTQPAGQGSSASGTSGMLSTVIPFILIIVIFYFFLIRPQNKKQKETEKMLKALKKGDKVVTIGGIHGVVSSVKEKTVVVKVDDATKIEFTTTAISGVELSDEEKAAIAKAEAEAKAAKKSNRKFGKKSNKESEESSDSSKDSE